LPRSRHRFGDAEAFDDEGGDRNREEAREDESWDEQQQEPHADDHGDQEREADQAPEAGEGVSVTVLDVDRATDQRACRPPGE
jgi:hypothetical protein